MTAFHRVEDCQAGPHALGILVPPGPRTFVILRPRSLAWDLLPLCLHEQKESGPTFAHMERDAAAGLARTLQQQLEKQIHDRRLPIDTPPNPWGEGHLVGLQQLDYFWVACPRQPGKPYDVLVVSTFPEAQTIAQQIVEYLMPDAESEHEFYFNTQHFSH